MGRGKVKKCGGYHPPYNVNTQYNAPSTKYSNKVAKTVAKSDKRPVNTGTTNEKAPY